MNKLSVFLSIFLITTSAYAEWELFFKSHTGNDYYYDRDSIKRNKNKIKVWNYTNLSEEEQKNPKYLNSASQMLLEEYDCVTETRKILQVNSYSKPDLNGDQIQEWIGSKEKYVPPGTNAYELMKRVCKK